jgi:malonyl CoA-acyl carrier protein transacylase
MHRRLPDTPAALQVEVRAPRVPVYSNVTAKPFPSDPAAIRALLGRQLCEPVKWEATLAALVGAGARPERGCSRWLCRRPPAAGCCC